MVKYLLFYLLAKIRQIRMCGSRFPILLQLGRHVWSRFVLILNAKILFFLRSFDSVNIVDNLYLACNGRLIFLLCITLVFCAEMVFSANCVCSHHSTWHHRDLSPDSLLIATAEELRFCNIDRTKNKNRKEKDLSCLPGKNHSRIYVTEFWGKLLWLSITEIFLTNARFTKVYCAFVDSYVLTIITMISKW